MDVSAETALRIDPSLIMEMLGFAPDPFQADLLRSQASRILLLCSRQLGKSTSTACVALNEAYLNLGSLGLLVSPSERQSEVLFAKVSSFHKRLRLVDSVKELSLSIQLQNGSSIIALPGSADTIRGYSSPDLIVIDEASRVEDNLLAAVMPMVVSNNGRIICLSTPRGKQGFFYTLWQSNDPLWTRINAKAADSPRISPEALAEQRISLGARLFSCEFENCFLEDTDQIFTQDEIDALSCTDGPHMDLVPLNLQEMCRGLLGRR